MKKTISYKIWQVLYPVGIYYVVSLLMFFALEGLIGGTQETYLLRQTICAAATIPFVLPFYRETVSSFGREPVLLRGRGAQAGRTGTGPGPSPRGERRLRRDAQAGRTGTGPGSGVDLPGLLLAAAVTGTCGIAVNNLIAMTPLIPASAGFAEANEAFFGGSFVYELLGSCLVIPAAEELLFRGVVYGRLRGLVGAGPAVAASALLFGLVHANVVQFVYAGVLGLLLAYLLERTGNLLAPVLGHMAANLAAVVRQETGWLAFSYERTAAGFAVTVGFAAAAVGMFFLFRERTK